MEKKGIAIAVFALVLMTAGTGLAQAPDTLEPGSRTDSMSSSSRIPMTVSKA
jgi:hypothetical protein